MNDNDKELIKPKPMPGKVSLIWLLFMVFARLILAAVIQLGVAFTFFQGHVSPLLAAGTWWPVYGTLIDLGCYVLIRKGLKTEGIRFRDLITFDRNRLRKDMLVGLLYVLWFFPLAMAGILASSWFVIGDIEPPSVYGSLPPLAAVYSLVVFPVIWALMEQGIYQGYVLPRLAERLPRREMAVIIVAFGWSLQHIALPLVFDVHFMLFRFLSFIPLAVANALIYLRTRRLIPFIVAHWLVDMVGILTGIVLPMMLH